MIAPHPDDDVIGCGGALARFVAAGADIRVVIVTDGAASHPRSRRFPPDRLRAVRETEARAALRVLGIARAPRFLRCPDGGVALLGAVERTRVVRILAAQTARATTVFAPLPADPHADHVAVADLFTEACALVRRVPAIVRYGVWTPVRGTLDAAERAGAIVLALDARERERKRDAILAHRSQASGLIDDDPDGFRIDDLLLATWVTARETLYAQPRRGLVTQ